jgi:hypothetical protein
MSGKKLKIAVGIPSYSGKLFPETAATVGELSRFKEIDFEVSIIPYLSRSMARNLAVTRSRAILQKHKFDYFLSMDADISFPVSAVLMLLDRELDIVSAAYPMRSSMTGETMSVLCSGYWKEFIGHAPRSSYLPENSTGLVGVDTTGLGCCLISKKVFETLEFPYFRNNIVQHEGEAFQLEDDLSFCMDATEKGFPIYCDCDVRALHNAGNEER